MNQRKILSTAILLVLTGSAWSAKNPEYAETPYGDISTQKLKLFNENTTRTGQIGKKEVDFFEILNNAPDSKNPFPIADVELEFSCPQAETSNAYFGWYISIWKHFDTTTGKPDEYLKGYNDVLSGKCKDKFSMLIEQNDYENAGENKVASYYVGIQSACVTFPDTTILREYYPIADSDLTKNQSCDTSDYKLKLGLIPKEIIADTSTLTESELKNSTPLGAIETGRINLATDNNIYSVETYSTKDTAGTTEVPLLFSCTAEAARRTNDWKLTVYDNKNTIVAGYPRYINGSDCGSTMVDDKGGFKFTLPKDSPRYFVSVQSACDSRMKKECPVETSPYNIARDVSKIYTGNLSSTKSITATNASFKLTRCGVNSNSTIAVKVDNEDLTKMFKSKIPIKIQIGTMACQVLTRQSFNPAKDIMLGSITGNAEMIDAQLIAKDSATVTLSECISSNAPDVASKITLTGTKLDLENLNPVLTTTITTGTTATGNPIVAPTTVNPSVVIPVKVDIGDFHCEGKDAFYINADKPKVGDTTYSNNLPTDIEDSTPAVNLELSKTAKIETATDMQLYYVDSSINSDTKLNFSCDASTRFNNDWKVLIYNSNKTLNGTPYIINGSDCAAGQSGDNGVYKITIPLAKDVVRSERYYVAVKSACETDDSLCIVDKSPYILSREVSSIIPVVVNEFNASWLTTKKNLGATSQTGQINALADEKVYQVDTGTEDTNLTFSCNNAVRSENDWKVLIYDSTKTLKSTQLINGSSCGTGKSGDTGAYPITLSNSSPTYYVVVKSACETDDTTCTIDKSQYQLNRVSPPPPPEPFVDPIIKALSLAPNLGASQSGQIKSSTEMLSYKVDTASNDTNLTFTCPKSIRYQNDWKVLIYDHTKKLKSSMLINGSSCGTGQEYDTGAFAISLPKYVPFYYLVVESACKTGDKTCEVDKSQYEIKRVTTTQTTPTTTLCFNASCDAVSEKLDFPVFGAK